MGRCERRVARAFAVAAMVAFMGVSTPAYAAFPGENGRVAYVGDRGSKQIYVANPGGGCERQLTTALGGNTEPAQSADGGKIVFTSRRTGNPDIWIVNADGSNETQLTANPASDLLPTFAPDGRIAFISTRDGNSEIYVMNADGSGQTRLTNTTAAESQPEFSPDGTKIAFRRGSAVQIMNADGTGAIVLATSGHEPSFSPDGTRIAFRTSQGIEVIGANGTGRTLLLTGTGMEPAFSPDGTKIAYTDWDSGDWGTVGVMNADGSGAHTFIAGDESDVFTPDWGVAPLVRAGRASAIRGPGVGEPVAVGVNCGTNESAQLASQRVPDSGPALAEGHVLRASATEHSAAATAAEITISAPGVELRATGARAGCGESPAAETSIASLSLNGQRVGTSEPQTVPLPGGALRLNYVAGNTARAVWLDLEGDANDVVVAEAAC